METNIDDIWAFLGGYSAYALSLALAFYGAVSWFGNQHLTQSAKDNLTLWLWGEYESTWSQHFCDLFDAVFGDKHLSWNCFIRSAFASVLAVLLLYLLFDVVLGLLDPAHRAGGDLSIGKALLLGATINIIPDYISLFETRWLLQRLERVTSVVGQLVVLIIDAVLTGCIIWLAINAFQWSIGEPSLTAIEILALFSIFSVFFYSTFLTSVWAWIFCLSTWLMRLFSRTSLNKLLDVESKPASQVALVGAALIFVVALVLTPVFKKAEQQPVSAFDDLLCEIFPADVCEHLGRLSHDEKLALSYLEKACKGGGSTEVCLKTAEKYFKGNQAKAAGLWSKACEGGASLGCENLAYSYYKGRGVLKDEVKAVGLYQQACDLGSMSGCKDLGIMYEQGFGVQKDEVKAVDLYRQACHGGSVIGCSYLGDLGFRNMNIGRSEPGKLR